MRSSISLLKEIDWSSFCERIISDKIVLESFLLFGLMSVFPNRFSRLFCLFDCLFEAFLTRSSAGSVSDNAGGSKEMGVGARWAKAPSEWMMEPREDEREGEGVGEVGDFREEG